MGALATVAVTQPRAILGMNANAAASDTYRHINLFGDIFERVRTDYVEKPDDTAKLIETRHQRHADRRSTRTPAYMDARKSFRDMQVQTRGEFGGLGIEVTHGGTASSRSSRRSTIRPPPRPASSPTTSSRIIDNEPDLRA